MNVIPISISDACEFVRRVHRHHKPPQGAKFAIAIEEAGQVCGVSIVGRPVSRHLDDGWTAEVTRLATDGRKNACSMLYSASWRAARAMGYRRMVTYILQSETGTSLIAAGWKLISECGGGSWSRTSRPRIDKAPLQNKIRFEVKQEREP